MLSLLCEGSEGSGPVPCTVAVLQGWSGSIRCTKGTGHHSALPRWQGTCSGSSFPAFLQVWTLRPWRSPLVPAEGVVCEWGGGKVQGEPAGSTRPPETIPLFPPSTQSQFSVTVNQTPRTLVEAHWGRTLSRPLSGRDGGHQEASRAPVGNRQGSPNWRVTSRRLPGRKQHC